MTDYSRAYHSENLKKLCRLCARKLQKKSYCINDQIKELCQKSGILIDFSNDSPYFQPSKVCSTCETKLRRQKPDTSCFNKCPLIKPYDFTMKRNKNCFIDPCSTCHEAKRGFASPTRIPYSYEIETNGRSVK